MSYTLCGVVRQRKRTISKISPKSSDKAGPCSQEYPGFPDAVRIPRDYYNLVRRYKAYEEAKEGGFLALPDKLCGFRISLLLHLPHMPHVYYSDRTGSPS